MNQSPYIISGDVLCTNNNTEFDKGSVILSVIIPVYNTEQFLPDCLDSLIEQDFHTGELQVVCVDDGSTDSSLEILKKYNCKYPFIEVFSKQNGGVSSARNLGLDNAVGRYISFVDSDDYFLPHTLCQMIRCMVAENAVSASFGFRLVENGKTYNHRSPSTISFYKRNKIYTSYCVWGDFSKKHY